MSKFKTDNSLFLGKGVDNKHASLITKYLNKHDIGSADNAGFIRGIFAVKSDIFNSLSMLYLIVLDKRVICFQQSKSDINIESIFYSSIDNVLTNLLALTQALPVINNNSDLDCNLHLTCPTHTYSFRIMKDELDTAFKLITKCQKQSSESGEKDIRSLALTQENFEEDLNNGFKDILKNNPINKKLLIPTVVSIFVFITGLFLFYFIDADVYGKYMAKRTVEDYLTAIIERAETNEYIAKRMTAVQRYSSEDKRISNDKLIKVLEKYFHKVNDFSLILQKDKEEIIDYEKHIIEINNNDAELMCDDSLDNFNYRNILINSTKVHESKDIEYKKHMIRAKEQEILKKRVMSYGRLTYLSGFSESYFKKKLDTVCERYRSNDKWVFSFFENLIKNRGSTFQYIVLDKQTGDKKELLSYADISTYNEDTVISIVEIPSKRIEYKLIYEIKSYTILGDSKLNNYVFTVVKNNVGYKIFDIGIDI